MDSSDWVRAAKATRAQAATAGFSPADHGVALTLIDATDEGGYLRGELAEFADRLGCGLERIEAVLAVCHGFEPTGVMARSVPECLKLQLIERNRFDPAMAALLDNLDLLARRDLGALSDDQYDGDDPELIDCIIRHLLPRRGIRARPDQVLLTMSGTQAIDLICRFLLRPGDTVLVDDPCYFNFRALLRAHQVKLVSVPYTPSGPDVASFEAVLEAERPRLYITVSGLHNPTGATMSPQTAHRVLNAATACDLTIVEDDIFADFEPEPSARLAALDGLNRVIRIGSFSKTLSASLRCGFIAARADWIEQLVDLQVATGFGGPCAVATEIIASVLATGFYRKHVEELRRRLARARRDVGEKLQRIGIEPWLMPRGGFQLWCRLPDGCDSADVARAALADNIVLAPGNVFSTTQSASGFMRFNVAQCRDPKLMPALQRALGR